MGASFQAGEERGQAFAAFVGLRVVLDVLVMGFPGDCIRGAPPCPALAFAEALLAGYTERRFGLGRARTFPEPTLQHSNQVREPPPQLLSLLFRKLVHPPRHGF